MASALKENRAALPVKRLLARERCRPFSTWERAAKTDHSRIYFSAGTNNRRQGHRTAVSGAFSRRSAHFGPEAFTAGPKPERKALLNLHINGRALSSAAVLLQTGRGIAAGDSPGVYLFYWDNILYRLDLRKSLLSWEDHTGEARNMKVLYHQGITYVQGGFLAEALGLPIN